MIREKGKLMLKKEVGVSDWEPSNLKFLYHLLVFRYKYRFYTYTFI